MPFSKIKLHQVVLNNDMEIKIFRGGGASVTKGLEIHGEHFACSTVGNGEPRVIRREKGPRFLWDHK